MPALTIGWEYLTGHAVATAPGSRQQAEWPPHPGRVFLAMAAAWFETDEDPAEGQALRWLEQQFVSSETGEITPPAMYLPEAGRVFERTKTTAFVPVNDKAGPAASTLQSVPALARSKQPRTYPQVFVGDATCYLHWPYVAGLEVHREPLGRLCAKVTRLGHSSSLVWMWLEEAKDEPAGERWEPDEGLTATEHVRLVVPGTLDALPEQTQIPHIERFANFRTHIDDATRRKEQAKRDSHPTEKRAAQSVLSQAKAEYEQHFDQKWQKSVSPPPLRRPKLGLWSGYRRDKPQELEPPVCRTHFDQDLLALKRVAGPQLTVAATLAVTRALRATIMKCCGIQPAPEWVCGHRPAGEPSERDSGHLALIPLPFVGHEHADGHLMGAALAFPRPIDRRGRGQALGPMLLQENGQPREVELKLGGLGVWTVRKREWSDAAKGLMPEQWTGYPDGAKTWASVTPVVLDKFPKADRSRPEQRPAWEEQVRAIVADACGRIGLPRPIAIDIDTTSWHRGSPRAFAKRRPVRGGSDDAISTTMGDGFAFYPAKGANAPKPQVHAWLRFAEPVVGPVLLGAGRYRGYGLFKPWCGINQKDGP